MFFFKQMTAYEMRISDWSSDVCSSDLLAANAGISLRRSSGCAAAMITTMGGFDERIIMEGNRGRPGDQPCRCDPRNGRPRRPDRTSVASGQRVSVRVDLGCRRIFTQHKVNYA